MALNTAYLHIDETSVTARSKFNKTVHIYIKINLKL